MTYITFWIARAPVGMYVRTRVSESYARLPDEMARPNPPSQHTPSHTKNRLSQLSVAVFVFQFLNSLKYATMPIAPNSMRMMPYIITLFAMARRPMAAKILLLLPMLSSAP